MISGVAAVVRKELLLLFGSMLFYALTAVFLVLCGFLFYTNLDFYVRFGGTNQVRGLWQYQLFDMRERLLVLVPLVTMRLFAEERRLGTLELLWTYPLRDAEIIAGKYVASLAVVTVMLAGTLAYPAVLSRLHPVDWWPLFAGYAGLWLLAAAFVACGLFLSALTDSQLVAAASTYGVLLFFWMLTWNEAAVGESNLRVLRPFSLFDRFETFAQGGVDTRDVTFLVLFATVFLCFTFFALDVRRWRGLRS
jgi:gliding motility-associated transport system permease protein